ncbi:MAG: DUF3782 domain-containing protein [Chloroflexi bacterium]|nr:DUF3782 domain-containing protein [Chloroflexota bacterium]
MNEFDLETIRHVLKEELPRVLREHPEVRYELRGMMLEAFPSRDEFNQLLEELRQHREESNYRFDRVDQRLDNLEQGQDALQQGQRGLEQGQRALEQGQRVLEQRMDGVEQGQRSLVEGQRALEQRQTNLENVVADLKQTMETGFADLRKDLSRLGQRWGLWNESVFRETISALLEKSFGAHVEARVIQGEQFDLIITNGVHILVEIAASAGPNIQRRLERKRNIYIQATGVTPDRIVLATASIHSRRAQALREAGFEVIEPEPVEED